MHFLKDIFRTKPTPINSYDDFWKWFLQNEKAFFKVIKGNGNIETKFFDKIAPELNKVKDGIWYLAGMYDDNTVELVLTADGNIKNMVFVEELVAAAPELVGWKLTALKPALEGESICITMASHEFNTQNLHFYPNDLSDYPDEVNIVVVHDDLTEANKDDITHGVYIFLDNYLGELDFALDIDNMKVISKASAEKELISMTKLKDYLAWRKKEFIEKYEGVWHNTSDDEHSVLEAELNNGNVLIATVNTSLFEWDSMASHPWILTVEIPFIKSKNGMPSKATYQQLDKIENEILHELKDVDGYLNLGRQTADNKREIYFACKNFRKPSKVLHQIQRDHQKEFEISYDFIKDKYWRSLDRLNPA